MSALSSSAAWEALIIANASIIRNFRGVEVWTVPLVGPCPLPPLGLALLAPLASLDSLASLLPSLRSCCCSMSPLVYSDVISCHLPPFFDLSFFSSFLLHSLDE